MTECAGQPPWVPTIEPMKTKLKSCLKHDARADKQQPLSRNSVKSDFQYQEKSFIWMALNGQIYLKKARKQAAKGN